MIVFYNFNEELFLSTPSARRATFSKYLWGCCVEFYPRPPRGGRPVDSGRVFGGTHFYPRPPRGGRRLPPSGQRLLQETHFYPRPPRGGRRISMPIWTMKFNFYPRPPRGGRRKAIPCWQSRSRFLSTPSARRATRRSWQGVQLRSISIHALREEGDDKHALVIKLLKIFLSTPSARRATRREVALNVRKKFLSTPSARRATIISSIIVLPLSISIHALREEGDRRRLEVARHEAISIHALREEGDKSVRVAPHRNGDFYPRPPRGGRPWAVCILPLWAYFYPRPPRGGRRKWQYTINSLLVFLSTPSARRATPNCPTTRHR